MRISHLLPARPATGIHADHEFRRRVEAAEAAARERQLVRDARVASRHRSLRRRFARAVDAGACHLATPRQRRS